MIASIAERCSLLVLDAVVVGDDERLGLGPGVDQTHSRDVS